MTAYKYIKIYHGMTVCPLCRGSKMITSHESTNQKVCYYCQGKGHLKREYRQDATKEIQSLNRKIRMLHAKIRSLNVE